MQVGAESTKAVQDAAKLRLNFTGRHVYLVMSGPDGAKVDISVDGLAATGGKDVNSQNR